MKHSHTLSGEGFLYWRPRHRQDQPSPHETMAHPANPPKCQPPAPKPSSSEPADHVKKCAHHAACDHHSEKAKEGQHHPASSLKCQSKAPKCSGSEAADHIEKCDHHSACDHHSDRAEEGQHKSRPEESKEAKSHQHEHGTSNWIPNCEHNTECEIAGKKGEYLGRGLMEEIPASFGSR
jgi:hypothetical protein